MPSGGRPFGSHTAATSFGIERRPLGPHDVLLDVLDCGVCAGVTGNDLVKTRTSIAGSLIGSIAETQQVIDC